jgi:hypothetical protein
MRIFSAAEEKANRPALASPEDKRPSDDTRPFSRHHKTIASGRSRGHNAGMAESLESMLRAIVREEFPASLEPFNAEVASAISDVSAGRSAQTVDKGAHAGFGGISLDEMSDYIKLITATVTLITAFSKRSGASNAKPAPPKPSDLQSKWLDELCKTGINAEQAERISAKFVQDLQTQLDK